MQTIKRKHYFWIGHLLIPPGTCPLSINQPYMIRNLSLCFALVIATVCSNHLLAQSTTGQSGDTLRPVIGGVPFINFTPDSRSAGMGDAGVAASPDANSIFWNTAKLAFAEKSHGLAISYTPWLRNLVGDMSFTYLSGYKKIGKNQAIGLAMMYFDLGKFEGRNGFGALTGEFYSRDFYINGSYARKLSDNFSVGLNLKYINSNPGVEGSVSGGNISIKPASTAAADISLFYQKDNIDTESNRGWKSAYGLMISNLGGKINYGGENYFISTNFKIGTALTRQIDSHNKITFLLDFNKLMVPTPPVLGNALPGQTVRPVLRGKPLNRDYTSAVFGSFADAPDGFKEELREFTISAGLEYWYNNQFAIRGGYFNESNTKGGRKYATVGFGFKIQDRYGIDMAYMMPFTQNSPLANTFRISLLLDLVKKPKATTEQEAEDSAQ